MTQTVSLEDGLDIKFEIWDTVRSDPEIFTSMRNADRSSVFGDIQAGQERSSSYVVVRSGVCLTYFVLQDTAPSPLSTSGTVRLR